MAGEELPRAHIRRRRVFRLSWIVPLVAMVIAGWLVAEHLERRGPEIKVSFGDVSGVRIGQTPVRYRGVEVGQVVGTELSEDRERALVRIQLHESAAGIAREGARFWIVRPRVGWGAVSGLSTVLTGPEIQVLPSGEGARAVEFVGLESAPVGLESDGLRLVLRATRPKAVRAGTPVYYRGVEVGAVQEVGLSPNAAAADLHVLVFRRYAPLVREGSVFWNTSGVTAQGTLLKGLELELESIRSLVQGGVEFATPSAKAARAKPGAIFFLHDGPRDEWLNWEPHIRLPAGKD
ncbi:MAG TPA: MlaD family protein [Burkholderiales bacterium]|nr:MlaD family protein [Burkholderiales bacterium]